MTIRNTQFSNWLLNDLILLVMPFKPQTVDLTSALAVFEKLNIISLAAFGTAALDRCYCFYSMQCVWACYRVEEAEERQTFLLKM